MKKKKQDNLYLPEDVRKFAKRRKIKRIVILVIIVLIIGFVFVKRLRKPKPRVDNGAIPVQVTKIVQTDVERIIRINGEIKAQFGASIFSDVAGRVRVIYKREGEFVPAGAPLVSVDRRSTGVDYLDFIVRSPISGIVGSVDVETGYTISPNTQLMKVVNTRFMECVVDLVEKDIGSVKIGMNATIKVDAYDVKYIGRITKISTIVHPQTRTFQVTILIDNANYPNTPLKDGMYANATIVTGMQKNAAVVPYSAILDNEGEKYLFVALKQRKDGKETWLSQRRTVTVGSIKRVKQADGEFIDFAEIIRGVQPGEFVVFMGHRFLQDKTAIELRTEIGNKMRITEVREPVTTETGASAVQRQSVSPPSGAQNVQRPAAVERRNTPVQPSATQQSVTPPAAQPNRQQNSSSGQTQTTRPVQSVPAANPENNSQQGRTIRGAIPMDNGGQNQQGSQSTGGN